MLQESHSSAVTGDVQRGSPRPGLSQGGRRPLLRWLVSRSIGGLLLAGAALKVQGLGVGPVAALGVFSPPAFQLATVLLEVFLGLWLLSGKQQTGSWLTALGVFITFAGVSSYLTWVGQSSCGCFGKLSVKPGNALLIDLAALTALLVGRPDLKPLWANLRSSLARLIISGGCGLAGIVVICGLLLGLASASFGSVAAAVAYFRGERVSVQPRLVEVGEGVPGEQRTVTVELANWTDKPVRLIGGTTGCSCTVLNDLPLTIPAKEVGAVSVRISLSGKPGVFTRKVAFLVDDDGFQAVAFRLTGRILAPDDSPRATSSER